MAKPVVVIAEAAPLDYLSDYVALPRNYGTPAYFERPDVQEIRRTVFAALDQLNERIDLDRQIHGRKVILKPNLVVVYHNTGYRVADMPQTTDPRVFEAVVDYLTRFTRRITIAESSGSGLATASNFRITGYDRIARRYGAELVVLEHQPVDRYMLPKAEIMKEVVIPRLLSEVVRGEAYYVSVPKMKTNLYTGVTLGFKNAMGTLPTYLRYRNHSYQIHKKLVDLLYLFKPDLSIIDGIVGAEGLTPGPVDPIDMRAVIASNHSVEADRIATAMMGFDPESNPLMVEAQRRGFGDPSVEVIGAPWVVPFRPADPSLLSERFRSYFPRIKFLVGQTRNSPPPVTALDQVTPEQVGALERACGGGCLPALASVFEMYRYARQPVGQALAAVILYGEGVEIAGKRYYFDAEGCPYDSEAIRALPVKKYAIGECARSAAGIVDVFSGGCCDITACTFSLPRVTGVLLPQMSLDNRGLLPMLLSVLETYWKKRRWIRQGEYVDVPYRQQDFDRVFPIPELTPEQMAQDFIAWPLPQMTQAEIRQNLRELRLF